MADTALLLGNAVFFAERDSPRRLRGRNESVLRQQQTQWRLLNPVHVVRTKHTGK